MVYAFEDIGKDKNENAEVTEIKKYKDFRIKNLLVQATQTYELLTQFFGKYI